LLPSPLLDHLKNTVFNEHWEGDDGQVSPVGGGCINHCFRIDLGGGTYFLKHNTQEAFPGMFEAEGEGLRLLRETETIRIPDVIDVGTAGDQSYLLLEWIDQGPPRDDFWPSFGRQLAALHRTSADQFGLDYDNYIGSLHQVNDPHKDWTSFFIEERLKRQIRQAARFFSLNDERGFDSLFVRLPEIFPNEPPSLIHGDLWSGNFMCTNMGEPVLMDPAVYYGSREMDLAMMRLFGGFSPEMFDTYDQEFPLVGEWKERLDICNLYPLLVHVNLFGEGYMSQMRSILRRFLPS
jgi:protein-ribulosamine 3-kinase